MVQWSASTNRGTVANRPAAAITRPTLMIARSHRTESTSISRGPVPRCPRGRARPYRIAETRATRLWSSAGPPAAAPPRGSAPPSPVPARCSPIRSAVATVNSTTTSASPSVRASAGMLPTGVVRRAPTSRRGRAGAPRCRTSASAGAPWSPAAISAGRDSTRRTHPGAEPEEPRNGVLAQCRSANGGM